MERHTTFRFTAVTDDALEEVFRRHAGARRIAYNECLSMVRDGLDRKRAGELGSVPWSGFDLINAFNAWKASPDAGRVIAVDRSGAGEVVPTGLSWRKEVCAQVFEEAAVDLGRALGAFRAGKRAKRRPVGFPSFK